MKNLYFTIFLLIFGSSCTVVKDVATLQVTEDPVIAYLKSSGIPDQFQIAFDEMLQQLETEFPKTRTNDTKWSTMESQKKKAMAQIIDDLASVYRKHFTKEDLKAMTDFYLSDTGRKIIANDYDLSMGQQESLNAFYASEVGQKVIEKQVVLRAAIDRLTFKWSTDLYSTGLSILNFDN